MTLDATTPRGRTFIERQRTIAGTMANAHGLVAANTPGDRESPVDTVFIDHDGNLAGIAEIKARDLSLAQLRLFGSYLVTLDKLIDGRALARELCVPFFLVVGLTDAIAYWVISDAAGAWAVDLHAKRTKTQATCNGGTANRTNAYLSLEGMLLV